VTNRPIEEPASSTGLPPNLAAVLAYSAWWISGLLLWWLERRDAYVRFHAAQSVVAFGVVAVLVCAFAALAVFSLAVRPGAFVLFLWAAGLTWAGGMALWVVATWQALRGRTWRMPLVAGLADRLLNGRSGPDYS
jgi:uncharacterized membrane protein